MILQVVLALGLAVVVLGDGCCAPKKWEGNVMVAGGYTTRFGKRGSTNGAYGMSYDGKGQKIAVTGTYKKKGEEEKEGGVKYKLIYDFKAKKGYFIVPSSSKCKSFDLKKKFRPLCIPDDAKKMGSSYLGAGDNTLDVTAYAVAYKKGRSKVGAYISVTKEGCVPVAEDIAGEVKGTGFFSNVNYVGITAGIKDATIFTPPDYCKEGVVELLEKNLHTQFSLLQLSLPSPTEF